MSIVELLATEEGFRETPYYCSEGYPTVGYGFKIGAKGAPLPEFRLPEPAARVWLTVLVAELETQLAAESHGLCDERRAVVISMAYQMGLGGLRGFKKFLAALKARDWATAAREMLDSKWARQTAQRAKRHSAVILTGSFSGVYSV